ncbi:MAG: AAA family ATPase [Actinomycetota bacterium]|nr:AAA family ATPase [Actinomycetota bacterium]
MTAPVGAVTVSLADVLPERVDWLWFGRLPLGKIVVLDGDPSVGKSTTAVDCAARVSTGALWPDGAPNRRGDVLLLSAEDGLADTIRPRLDAAHGDPARVHALTEIRYCDEAGEVRTRPVTLSDLDQIERTVKATRSVLVVIDVLMAFLPSKVDSHRDQDVRGLLSGLAAMAERTGSCVLLLRHLNKSAGGSAMYRGGGSIGIIGAARVGLLAAVDPEDDERRVLAGIKSNLAPLPSALSYQLVDSPEHGCARVQWLGTSAHNAGSLLSMPRDDDERTERDEAVEWLTKYLVDSGGETIAADVIKAANRDGIAKTTLHRARKRAGVTSTKDGFGGPWIWRLDAGRFREGSEDPSLRDREPWEPSRNLRAGDDPLGDA